ncbi:hypothetical protein [Chamaesiphon minutus]|uniref:Uncharacterized protein n=1 Tax=Chamaesiphon minutus (strain ATCC 27169 / PCC 6605) TaxID=1173020 RepID=K9UPN7_CHAP6|nr:hypothetical protein [Chamaesiphon minutus]AFY96386.1 hypothetical protein Cha6605_5506 [Chamaesiphon minutus PCC 6605]
MKNMHRYLYLVFVTLWLLNQYKYLTRIDFSSLDRQRNYALIDRLIIDNFLFGAFGIVISLLIISQKKTSAYLIFTCALGLAIAIGTIYLDASFTRNGGQAHLNSVMAFFGWMIPISIAGWSGIFKDLGAAIMRKRDDR